MFKQSALPKAKQYENMESIYWNNFYSKINFSSKKSVLSLYLLLVQVATLITTVLAIRLSRMGSQIGISPTPWKFLVTAKLPNQKEAVLISQRGVVTGQGNVNRNNDSLVQDATYTKWWQLKQGTVEECNEPRLHENSTQELIPTVT